MLDLSQEEQEAIAEAETVLAVGGVSNPDDWLKSNERLYLALQTAKTSTDSMESEQVRILKLLKEAKSTEEREAREFQLEYLENYLVRASELAKLRLKHFESITDTDKELEKVKSDISYWFKYYAWGYDPRARTNLSVVPFELFPTQEKMVEWLDGLVFDRRTSGLIEKSRDEGATETIVRWGVYHWLFNKGFSMLFSTRKEDEVDAKKNQNTLFERMRFQIRLLPSWMLPKNFDIEKDMLGTMKIANTENENTLLGEAPVENMGRGGRVTCAMLDEFAFWRFAGYPQFRSLSQTTDSIIMPSSVAGKLNQYADIAFDGITPKFVMDWRDNPFKDKRWYNALPFGYISPKMNRTSIAQEVDRDYDASQPGKVWKFDEKYIFITQSEFLRPYKEAGLEHRFFDKQGKFRIPQDWRVIRTSDYGQSEGHDWSYGLFAQPTAFYPYSDTHFCFVNVNLQPTGLTTKQAVDEWRKLEVGIGLRENNASYDWINTPHASYVSHEQDGKKKAAGEESGLRTVLLNKYGENWNAWKPDYATGIDKIDDWFTPIENETPNPFRPEVSGRCQLLFVAPDGEYQLAFNERLNSHFVTVSKSEQGFFTARKQLSAYHYPETELGKAVKKMRPVKEFDDIVDDIRGYAVMWNAKPKRKTQQEQVAQTMDEQLPQKVVEKAKTSGDERQISTANSRRNSLASKIKEKLEKQQEIKPEWTQIG